MDFYIPEPTEEDFLNRRKCVLVLSLSDNEGVVTNVEIIDNGKSIRITLDNRSEIIEPNQIR